MDKRTLLALGLMAMVLVVTPMLFRQSRTVAPVADSPAARAPAAPNGTAPVTPPAVSAPTVSAPTGAATIRPDTTTGPKPADVRSLTPTVLSTPAAQYTLLNPGASLSGVSVSS